MPHIDPIPNIIHMSVYLDIHQHYYITATCFNKSCGLRIGTFTCHDFFLVSTKPFYLFLSFLCLRAGRKASSSPTSPWKHTHTYMHFTWKPVEPWSQFPTTVKSSFIVTCLVVHDRKSIETSSSSKWDLFGYISRKGTGETGWMEPEN